MKDWTILPENIYRQVWDKFFKDLYFEPSVYQKDWPSITPDRPHKKFSIKNLWGASYDELISSDFIQKGIDAFVAITNPEEVIYALEWQSDCFFVNPRKLTVDILTDNESAVSVISFIPDGDYYIFITKDFENIWFGHPWEKTITILGERLINSFNRNRPLFLLNEE